MQETTEAGAKNPRKNKSRNKVIWEILDALYDEEHSSRLFTYWKDVSNSLEYYFNPRPPKGRGCIDYVEPFGKPSVSI